MSSRPRGFRAVVSNSAAVDGRVTTLLICGHSITRDKRNVNRRNSICPTCRKTDGEAVDRVRAARLAS